jgi:hypothetical protein
MPRLSSPEVRIIRSILVAKFGASSPLLDRIQSLKFESRQMTGTGYYIRFANPQDLPAIDELNSQLSADLRTNLSAPRDVVSFTLFIRNGFLTSFEGYTFGDVGWPEGLMEDWLILDRPDEQS